MAFMNTAPLYVQIWSDRLIISDAQGQVVFDQSAELTPEKPDGSVVSEHAVLPFAHPRSLIGDFFAGQELLKKALNASIDGKLAPKVVIHPMEKTEGGLTWVEEKAWQEMALGAGASETLVHQGEVLSANEWDFNAMKVAQKPQGSTRRGSTPVWLVIAVVCAMLSIAVLVSK